MNFENWNQIEPGFFIIGEKKFINDTQALTNDAFSEKWQIFSEEDIAEQEKLFKLQRKWFLELYGFQDEKHLAEHLQRFEYILDAGCGLGYKAAWFAKLAPTSKVIGIDFSSASYTAHQRYKNEFSNLVFAKGDIVNTLLEAGSIGFTVCDQVIMHTDDPQKTLSELSRITSNDGQVCCYWYRKKAY